jgi:hypothetical protein
VAADLQWRAPLVLRPGIKFAKIVLLEHDR